MKLGTRKRPKLYIANVRRHMKAERLEFAAIHWSMRHQKLGAKLDAVRARRKRIARAMAAVLGVEERLARLQDKLEVAQGDRLGNLFAAYQRERVALARRDERMAALRRRDERAAVQEQTLVEKLERFAIKAQI